MLNAPREDDGITLTPTRLKFVSVRLIVTTRLLAPPAMLTVAPQKSAVPTHLTVCLLAAPAGEAANAAAKTLATTIGITWRARKR